MIPEDEQGFDNPDEAAVSGWKWSIFNTVWPLIYFAGLAAVAGYGVTRVHGSFAGGVLIVAAIGFAVLLGWTVSMLTIGRRLLVKVLDHSKGDEPPRA